MDFVDDVINVIKNKDDQKIKYTIPLQWLIFEYGYSTCYDCKIMLIKDYECKKCNIIRCRFHHFVNSISTVCVECYKEDIGYSTSLYHRLYNCIYCKEAALYGYVDVVILCKRCYNNNKEQFPNIICFADYCDKKLGYQCCGTGWFKDKTTKQTACLKHKNENCDYYYK